MRGDRPLLRLSHPDADLRSRVTGSHFDRGKAEGTTLRSSLRNPFRLDASFSQPPELERVVLTDNYYLVSGRVRLEEAVIKSL